MTPAGLSPVGTPGHMVTSVPRRGTGSRGRASSPSPHFVVRCHEDAGARSPERLAEATVGLVGLGGGNSHTAQQLAHLGVGWRASCGGSGSPVLPAFP